MADLMNGTYTYTRLANKYGNFFVPAAKILVDGEKALPTGEANLMELEVTLSLNPAGSAVIRIAGAYDIEARSFHSDVKGKFSLGKTVTVELGYLSDTTAVFKGFVASVQMEFLDKPMLTVTAMDVRRLMMQADSRETYYSDSNYSDIVAAILSPYSSLCLLEQEAGNDNLEKAIYQKVSDYSFIKDTLAKKLNKEFFVLGDKAYFRTPRAVSSPVLALEYGAQLLSFQRKSDYLDCKVLAGGYDKNEQKAVFAQEEVKSSDTQTAVLSEKPKLISVQEDAGSETELAVRASRIAREKKSRALTGKGVCIGLPEIVPGRFIRLDKLDGDANQKYYVVEVKHHLGAEGFYTEFEVEG